MSNSSSHLEAKGVPARYPSGSWLRTEERVEHVRRQLSQGSDDHVGLELPVVR